VATGAALGVSTWVGGYDMTGDSNRLALNLSYDGLDATVFGVNTVARDRRAGLESVAGELAGFWQAGAGTIDPQAFANMNVTQPVTHTPTGAAGSVSYSYQAKDPTYRLFGQVGMMIPFTLGAIGVRGAGTASVGAVRGLVAAAKGNVSATGQLGTVVQVGAVATGQYLYAVVHCFTAGTTITIQVQSDDNAGMSSPTTVATFPAITAAGGYWLTRVAGPITDSYWRCNVSAVTGTFNVAGAIAIK